MGRNDSTVISTNFKGKTVLITGASSGLGEALALELAEISRLSDDQPINIILSSRSIEKLESVAERCKTLSPKSIIEVIGVDMSSLDESSGGSLDVYMNTLHQRLKDNSLSGIDCLIGCAGVSSRGTSLETSDKILRHVMNVNFFGPVALTKAIATDMIARGTGGRIAVVSSVQGKLGLPLRSSYATSKHALQGYFDCLRAELSLNGIHISVISPGYINTNLSLNAVTASGNKYGITDDTTKNGMTSRNAALMTLIAIANKIPDYVLADGKSHAAIHGKTLFPNLMSSFMNNRARKSINTA